MCSFLGKFTHFARLFCIKYSLTIYSFLLVLPDLVLYNGELSTYTGRFLSNRKWTSAFNKQIAEII